MAAPAAAAGSGLMSNPLVSALLVDLLVGKLGGGLAQTVVPANPASIGYSNKGFTMPVGDVVGAYRAAPSMAFQSALSQFFGGDGFNYSPEEIIQRTYERNLEALRETRAGEIAKAQLGVQQATNPAVAKAAADVQGKAYEFLGNAVAQSLKNPAFTSPAARAEVARAF